MIISAGVTAQNGLPHRHTRLHRLDCWISDLTYIGERSIQVGASQQTLRGQGIVLFKPQVCYTTATTAPRHRVRSIWVVFRPWASIYPYLELPEILPGIGWLSLEQQLYREEILAAYQMLLQWSRQPRPLARRLAENALERAWLLVADCLRGGACSRDPRLQASLDHMRSHFQAPLSVAALARTANLSPSRFAHLFQTAMGLAPVQYLEALRMEEAKSLLLSTNLPVGEIGHRVGYANSYHFSTRFRKRVGHSPSQFRKQTPS